ncbi:MAG: metallophosphoesterase [Clostridia bacterium]
MMRVGVFSDTHGNLVRLSSASIQAGKLDLFFHLGDFSSDATLIATQLNVPYFAVRGNCDYGSNAPREKIVTLENTSILLVHGDAFRDTYQLACAAEVNHCDAVLFGHSHVPLLTAQGPLLICNPGSLSLPRHSSAPSFAVLSIDGKDIDIKLISL